MELAKGPERGPLSACIDMPLPLCKYLLTSLKFSCICGKILLSVCVFCLHPSVMLSQPVRALMNTSGPLTVFVVKGSWV